MSIARHHTEWLALLDISGPFLSLKTLAGAFPQGLDAPDADVARELRLAYEEWLDATGGTRPDPALYRAWVEWVLRRVLGLPDAAVRIQGVTLAQIIEQCCVGALHGQHASFQQTRHTTIGSPRRRRLLSVQQSR